MDTIEKIKQHLDDLNLQELHVFLEGNHAKIIAVDPRFSELSRIKRQQLILSPLKPLIAANEVHAVHLTTLTPEDWEVKRGEYNL